MRVVALVRVSTEKQENEGASLDAQSRRFREIATARKWTVVAEFRGQESATKANSERAVLQDVLTCLRDQDVDGLWVYEQSRLTRGDELEVALLLREMRERKVMLYVGTESRDLTAIDQNMFFRIQNAVDEAETSRIRERMQRGRREKALQGRRTGGKSPYGYRNPPPGDPKRGTLQVVPEEAAIVRRIFREIAAGVSIRFLCRKFSAEGIPAPRSRAWGKTTIRRILDNPAYTGTAFDSIVIRDPGTIGKPCPSKEELDRIGLERATAIAALPELMAALETAEAALTGCRPNNQHLPGIRAALAKARPA